MKKIILALTILLSMYSIDGQAQFKVSEAQEQQNQLEPTTLGIVIYSNETETIWNALRLANFSLDEGDKVTIFLLGKGVELDLLVKKDEDLKEQTDLFLDNGGKLLGCGTCLESRDMNNPKVCKFSSVADLYNLVRKNKIVLTF